MASQGWPVRVEQLRGMAKELLKEKGVTNELGIYQTEQYMHQHSLLKTKFVDGLDKNRAKAQDPAIVKYQFDLYQTTKYKYNIKNENVYNINEKGMLQGIIGKMKVIILKHKKKQYMTEPGNCEWVTLIESISLIPCRRRLQPWIIFKGKQHIKQQSTIYLEAHIALSDKGWTDNKLGYKQLERCFKPQTRPNNPDEQRLLIIDGYASHVTTKAIRFCLSKNIILLCLPAHSTHILQPLNVGIFAALAALYQKGV